MLDNCYEEVVKTAVGDYSKANNKDVDFIDIADLEHSCKLIDRFIKETSATTVYVEIDNDEMINITVQCGDVVVTNKTSALLDICSETNFSSICFSNADNDEINVIFQFVGVWDVD